MQAQMKQCHTIVCMSLQSYLFPNFYIYMYIWDHGLDSVEESLGIVGKLRST